MKLVGKRFFMLAVCILFIITVFNGAVFAVTPADENFEAISGIASNPFIAGSLKFSGDGNIGTLDATSVVMAGDGGFTGYVLVNDYDYNCNVTNFQFESISQDNNFKLESFYAVVNSSISPGTIINIFGYDNNVQVASVENINLMVEASYGSGNAQIVYDQIFSAGGAPGEYGGKLTFGSAWGNVDKIVITSGDAQPFYLGIDTIDFSDPVVSGPRVSSVTVPPVGSNNGYYKAGDSLNFTVSFDEAVNVTGTPRIPITLNTGGTVYASYVSGSGTAQLVFTYTVAVGNEDGDGISVGGAIALNGGSIKDSTNTYNAILTLTGVGSTTGVKIDTTPPAVAVTGIDSDTGSSGLDAITTDSTLIIKGTAEGGSTIQVYKDGSHIGTAVADSTGSWILNYTGITLADGAYGFTATAADAAGNVSPISLPLYVTVDTVPPSAPSLPDLTAASDTGESNTDNIANDTTPTFTGIAEANSIVELFKGGSSIGTTTANGSGNWSFTASALTGGTYSITAKAEDHAGNISAASAALSITIDTTVPSVVSINRLTPAGESTNADSVTYRVTFSETVAGVDASDFTLTKIGLANGNILSVSATSGTTIDITVDTVSGDGALRLDLKNTGTGIADIAGNSISGGFTGGQLYTVDVTPPSAINISGQNGIHGSASLTLTAVGGPLSDASWISILNQLKANTGAGLNWITGVAAGDLTITPAGDGVTATLNNGNASAAVITADFAITAGNVVDRVGNTAGSDITIDSYLSEARVTGVSASTANGAYKAGGTIDITVTFDTSVDVTGIPVLHLETGAIDRDASYQGGTGTAVLIFRYTVQVGDASSNIEYIDANSLALNGGTIKNKDNVIDAVLTLPAVGSPGSLGSSKNIVIDTAAPAAVLSHNGADNIVKAGDTVILTAVFNEAMAASPAISISNGGVNGAAMTDSGDHRTWTYQWTVPSGVGYPAPVPAVATVTGNDLAVNAYVGGANVVFTIDNGAPGVVNLSDTDTDNIVKAGDMVTITVIFNENMANTPSINITNTSVTGMPMTNSSGDKMTWTYIWNVSSGNGNAVATVAGTDIAGNAYAGTDSITFTIDNTAPTVSFTSSDADNIVKAGDTVTVTATFSEDMANAPTISITNASVTGVAMTNVSGDHRTWTYSWIVPAGDSTAVATIAGTDIVGNAYAGTSNITFTIDNSAPLVLITGSDADRIVKLGDTVTITATFNEAMANTPTISISNGGVTGAAMTYSGNSRVWTYAWTVPSGDGPAVATVAGNDKAGNAYMGADNIVFTIDSIAPASAVTNISLADNDSTPGIDGRDLTVGFTDLADESDVASYKIYIYKDGEEPSNKAAMDALNTGSKLAVKTVAKTAGNDGTATALGSSVTKDSRNQLLTGGYYWVIVTASDAAGNYSFAKISAKVSITSDPTPPTPTPPSGGNSGSGGGSSSSGSSPAAPAKPSVEIKLNGRTETLGEVSTTRKDNRDIVTITVDDKKIEQLLERIPEPAQNDGRPPVIQIPVTGSYGVVNAELNGQNIRDMEEKGVILEIRTDTAAYVVPASGINIAGISQELGQGINLSDVKVSIGIAEASAEKVKAAENTAARGGYGIVAPPVDFSVSCTYKGKTVVVSKFSNYVERTVAIPAGTDPSKITTGIVMNKDGTFSHVPTTVVKIDGKYYAKINSLTNSTYSVIWNPKTFKDMEKHIFKNQVNEVASRLIMDSIDADSFMPDEKITRGEYIDGIVRSLGLLRTDMSTAKFKDVKTGNKYIASISAAVEYGIVAGYTDGTFRPDSLITREEAASILVNAMRIAGIKTDITDEEIKTVLSKYKDRDKISKAANKSVAICIKNGIFAGNAGGTFAPKTNISRGQTAAIILNMLKKAGLV